MALQAIEQGDLAFAAAADVVAALNADVLLLTGIDYDLRGQTLAAFAATVPATPYPYLLALRPNTGVATGFDLDGNGRFGEARDAMAFGIFAGQSGMAILSRFPIDTEHIRDFSGVLWQDLPDNIRPPETPATQRLSTAGHYEVPILLPDGQSLRLLAYYATPPVFDGPEDRNGRRNHDETAFWLKLLAGKLPFDPPKPPFVILGQSNLDPVDGEGRPEAIWALLAFPTVQNTQPKGIAVNTPNAQLGDPALDTASYDKIGGLRVEVVLPSIDLAVIASGVLRPTRQDSLTPRLEAASRHWPVWIDLEPP